MEKKQVLNSLSLSPLSETQRERERERERAQTTDDFTSATLTTVARRRSRFLRFSESGREKERELNSLGKRDGEQQQHAEQHPRRRRRARGERRHLFPRGRFFARRWVESSQHVRTRTGDANRTDPGGAKFAPE
jgi:hypothetical protein